MSPRKKQSGNWMPVGKKDAVMQELLSKIMFYLKNGRQVEKCRSRLFLYSNEFGELANRWSRSFYRS